ncbi:YbjN domain-containing protein [Sphingomonas fennica]|uniref:YbjN domain-containing protein n=1 Tax=Edaphosphingomonas fennica TaxID=114404 RepID=A0A2T4HVZ9_9SPHN|nr:YbjN domain-containing protein [Sphingomonas fennica]PTD19983.1 YbjN domain-containing protein [Sphingomonas fennica]
MKAKRSFPHGSATALALALAGITAMTAATSPAAATARLPENPGAAPAVLHGDDIDGFTAVLQDAGYKARIRTREDGQRYIDSAAGGVSFTVNFTECEGAKGCRGIRFLAWLTRPPTLDAKAVNEWNEGYRMARAAIDADDDLVLDYYISLVGGVSAANFLDSFDWWTTLVGDFRGFVEDKGTKALEPTKPDTRRDFSATEHGGTG